MKRCSIATAILVVVLGATASWADVIHVPADYTTIQAALNAAISGDIIVVAAGTYAGFTAATPSVELRGAQYNIDPNGALYRGTGDVDESVITSTIMITADYVTVNGFKTSYPINVGYDHAWHVNISYNISQDADGHWGAIHLHGVAAGPIYNQCDFAYIGYNTISGTTSPDWQGGGIWTVGNDDVTIEHNHVLNSKYMGIIALNHVGARNHILHNTVTGSGHTPIRFWGGSEADISYNVVDGAVYDGLWVDQAADNSTVSYNEISNVTYAAVALRTGAAGVNVHNNTITTSGTGIEVRGTNVTATDNCIHHNLDGIVLHDTATGVFHDNDIHDNTYWGLNNNTGVLVDAENNWWGHSTGPYHPTVNPSGLGNPVSDDVDFSPWTTGPTGAEPTTWGHIKSLFNR
ncbi:MAG: right-handed parallel beta-helix repeat-containing protein [Candidatus Eisenbacteria sp.]|nr:right-handed parallel beta-helix repeat-containing protein [Candidatus Eisenbacteria bacterium]